MGRRLILLHSWGRACLTYSSFENGLLIWLIWRINIEYLFYVWVAYGDCVCKVCQCYMLWNIVYVQTRCFLQFVGVFLSLPSIFTCRPLFSLKNTHDILVPRALTMLGNAWTFMWDQRKPSCFTLKSKRGSWRGIHLGTSVFICVVLIFIGWLASTPLPYPNWKIIYIVLCY